MSRKFLALGDDIRTGSKIELPKYLVEVGVPWTDLEGRILLLADEVLDIFFTFFLDHQFVFLCMFGFECAGQTENSGCFVKKVDSDLDRIRLSKRPTITKPSHGGVAIFFLI